MHGFVRRRGGEEAEELRLDNKAPEFFVEFAGKCLDCSLTSAQLTARLLKKERMKFPYQQYAAVLICDNSCGDRNGF